MIIGFLPHQEGVDAGAALNDLLPRLNENSNGINELNQVHSFGTRRLAIIKSAGSIAPCISVVTYPQGQLVVLSDAPLQDSERNEQQLIPEAPLSWRLPGRWLTISIPIEDRDSIQWATDPIGAQWFYFGVVRQGMLFSDNFRTVVQLSASDRNLDPHALCRALVLGYNLGQETVVPGIKLAPGGCAFEWRSGDFRILRTHQIRYGDALASASKSVREAKVEESFHEAALAWKDILPTRTGLSLSAGLDSRTALAYLKRVGVNPLLFTFGQPGSLEVTNAQEMARLVGQETKVFDIPSASWGDWRTNVQRLGAVGPVQNCGWVGAWLEMLAKEADAVVHGYLGDALTGNHLTDATAEQQKDWVSYWVNWSIGTGWDTWPGLHEHWRNNLTNRLQADFRAVVDGLMVAFPHQVALHLDFYCRQRRWVASQANEISTKLQPVCFFYHPAIWEVWSNLPLEELNRQTLYQRTGHNLFPNLFQRPVSHTEELMRRAQRKIKRIVTGSIAPSAEKPRVIERRRVLKSTQRNIIKQLEESRYLLDCVVDVDYVLARVKDIDAQNVSENECARIIRVINLSHLLNILIK